MSPTRRSPALLPLLAPLLWWAAFLPLAGQTAPGAAPEDPAHGRLRELREGVVKAIESRDVDQMLGFAHPDIVVTWQNGEVCRGHRGLREFYERTGRDTFLRFTVPYEADELTVLHGGDTGVAAGRVVAVYSLMGKEVELESRWTATLVLQDDRWLVAAYHVSLDALDNPILAAAGTGCWIAGAAGLAGGVAIAAIGCRLRRRRAKEAA